MPPFECRGYIALLDVLGFSELIARESRIDELRRYFDAVAQATEKIQGVEYVLFSDTIVISAPSSIDDLLAILQACSFGMHYLLKEGLPVRGAISHGTYVRERTQKGTLIAGQAFVEAYRFEKSQNWVGIAAAPSVLRQFPELGAQCELPPHLSGQVTWELEDRLRWAMAIQPCHAIPWHSEPSHGKDTLDGFAIVPLSPGWRYDVLPEKLQVVKQYLKKQELLAGNPDAQSKYHEPVRWIEQLSQRWVNSLGRPLSYQQLP